MDHSSAQRADLLQCGLHIGDGEIRQRCRVAGPSATFVNTDYGSAALRLPTAAFGLAPLGELDAEQSRPEPTRAIGVISWELDEAERSVHIADDNGRSATAAMGAIALSLAYGRRPRG